MDIMAVNTLEIRFFDDVDPRCIERLREYVDQFKSEPGCIGVSLNESVRSTHVWILCGCWATAADMTEHFLSLPMTGMVNLLIEVCANLKFSSFAPVVGEAS